MHAKLTGESQGYSDYHVYLGHRGYLVHYCQLGNPQRTTWTVLRDDVTTQEDRRQVPRPRTSWTPHNSEVTGGIQKKIRGQMLKNTPQLLPTKIIYASLISVMCGTRHAQLKSLI
jgi:hypothetical protein